MGRSIGPKVCACYFLEHFFSDSLEENNLLIHDLFVSKKAVKNASNIVRRNTSCARLLFYTKSPI